MIELFQILGLNSIIIIGLFESMYYKKVNTFDIEPSDKACGVVHKEAIADKMLLWFIPFYLRKILPEYIIKPIASCVICMASVHSTYVYWYFYEFNLHNGLQYLLYIPALAGINAIVLSFYDR